MDKPFRRKEPFSFLPEVPRFHLPGPISEGNLNIPGWLHNCSHLIGANLEERFAQLPDPSVAASLTRATYDFFISYRFQEAETYARKVAEELELLQYKVFFAGANPFPVDRDEVLESVWEGGFQPGLRRWSMRLVMAR
jgi:hypothetical protein